MNENHFRMRCLTALVVTMGLAMPCLGQDMRRYVPFDLDPDYVAKLQERLAMEQRLGPFKDLVKKMLAEPTKMDLDPAKIKAMKLDDPKFKEALQEWLENDPALRKSLADWIVKNPAGQQPAEVAKLRKLLEEEAKTQEFGGLKQLPPPPNNAEPVGAKDDPLARLTERAMKQTERTKLAEFLHDSPAWKQAFEELRSSLRAENAPRYNLGSWQAKLLAPDSETLKALEGTLDRLRDLPRPKLDRFTWETPGLGALSAPSLGPPGMSDLRSPSIGAGASWVLLALLCLLIGWRLTRWTKRATSLASDRPNLGPWPVRPEAVSTRAELVQAFDYLALWTLGLTVKSWNHQAVASRWREKMPACGETAGALAQLYEQARYTDGAEALPEPERELARRCLVQLAEVL